MKLEERLRPAPKACFFFAITHGSNCVHEGAHMRLSEEFGPLGNPSPVFSFSKVTPYYDEELGGEAWKYFVAAPGFMTADELVRVKQTTERIQLELAIDRGGERVRTVNIDPGYVNGWQVVLATVKNHSHRIYLGEGVFCEVTLRFSGGRWEPLPWTYPDYTTELALRFFDKERSAFNTLPKTMIRTNR
jgi:hypothetical protein